MRNLHLDHENRPVKHVLSEEERQMLVDRHFETAAVRQAEHDLALLKAAQLGEAFKRLEGG